MILRGPQDERYEGLLRDLRASRERLFEVVAGVTEEQFKRRPPAVAEAVAGPWSIAEVLAGMLGEEQRSNLRIEALLAGDDAPPAGSGPRVETSGMSSSSPTGLPESVVTDEERAEEARLGRVVPVPQIIHGLLATRRGLETLLGTASSGATGDTVHTLVREGVMAYEAACTARIEAIRASLPTREPRSANA